jgi:fibronectin type 3 domain-containing protein
VIKWEKVSGAKKYEVWYATSETGTYKKLTSTSSASYTYKKAKMDVDYYFKVRAYGSSTSSAGEYSQIVIGWRKLAKPSLSLSVSQSGKITAKWKKVTGAVGYELQCSINDGEYITIYTGTALSFVHTELAPGNRYTYRVRALASQEKATGDYGTVKSGTIQVGKPTVSITLSESGKPQLTWEAVEGAVTYQVYYATSKSGKYKLVETTESLTAIYEAAKSGKTAYFKVCAVDINGTAGDYSSKISIKSK